jgi:fructose-specific phosphotransferase system IIC component
MDNKISFLAGYILTAATTISAAGFLNAIVLGLLGGFFGLLGKEVYYYVKREVKDKLNAPK